jgi:hypothetical protein
MTANFNVTNQRCQIEPDDAITEPAGCLNVSQAKILADLRPYKNESDEGGLVTFFFDQLSTFLQTAVNYSPITTNCSVMCHEGS